MHEAPCARQPRGKMLTPKNSADEFLERPHGKRARAKSCSSGACSGMALLGPKLPVRYWDVITSKRPFRCDPKQPSGHAGIGWLPGPHLVAISCNYAGDEHGTRKQNVIVSGASSGIGAAAAKLFASEGANVVLGAAAQELDAIADEISAQHGKSYISRAM